MYVGFVKVGGEWKEHAAMLKNETEVENFVREVKTDIELNEFLTVKTDDYRVFDLEARQ